MTLARTPEQITRATAINRYPTPRQGRSFIVLYDQWTDIIGTDLCVPDAAPYPDDDLSVAAQIEAYAAARRRAALGHHLRCPCTACEVRRYHLARDAVGMHKRNCGCLACRRITHTIAA